MILRTSIGAFAVLCGMNVSAQTSPSKIDTTNGSDIAPVEIESVTILAPRKDVGQIVHLSGSEILITQKELKRFDQVDANQLLQSQPGVYTQQEDGWGLRMNVGLRGSGVLRSSRITLLEDGIPVAPAAYASPAAYFTTPTWKYSSIEILKGSAQLITGPQTTGGAINFLTPTLDEKTDLAVSTSLGNYGQIRNSVLGELAVAPRTSVGFGFNSSRAQGFKEYKGENASGYILNDGYIKVGHHLDKRDLHHLEFMASGTQELSNQTYLGMTEFDAVNNPRIMYTAAARDTMHLQRLMTRLSYTANLKKGWIRADVYRQYIDRNWHKLDKIDGGRGFKSIASVLMDPTSFAQEMAAMTGADSGLAQIKANKRIYVSRGVQVKGLYTQNVQTIKITHEAGARIHTDYEDRFQQNDEYQIANGEINPIKWGIQGADANRVDYAQGLSGYYRVTASYQLWTVQAGVRGESVRAWRMDFGKSNPDRINENVKTQENAVKALMPGFSLNRRVSKNWLAFGGIHRGFTPPGSTPNVLPEKSTNYELGLKHHSLPIQITYFRSEYNQLMGSDMAASGGTGSGDQFNGGRALVDGAEARYGLKFKKFTFEATATYTNARFTDSFKSTFEEWGNVQVNAPLPYMPKAQGTLMLGYSWKSVEFFLQSVYGASRRSSSSLQKDDLPASWIHNVSVNFQANNHWSFRFSAQNLTNKQHIVAARPAGYRTYAPRLILGTVTFSIQ